MYQITITASTPLELAEIAAKLAGPVPAGYEDEPASAKATTKATEPKPTQKSVAKPAVAPKVVETATQVVQEPSMTDEQLKEVAMGLVKTGKSKQLRECLGSLGLTSAQKVQDLATQELRQQFLDMAELL